MTTDPWIPTKQLVLPQFLGFRSYFFAAHLCLLWHGPPFWLGESFGQKGVCLVAVIAHLCGVAEERKGSRREKKEKREAKPPLVNSIDNLMIIHQ